VGQNRPGRVVDFFGMKISKVEQADGKGWNDRRRKWLKVRKRRLERRRAKHEPDCQPAYTKYKGWNT